MGEGSLREPCGCLLVRVEFIAVCVYIGVANSSYTPRRESKRLKASCCFI